MTRFNGFLSVCQVAFWEKNAGNCFTIDNVIRNFPAEHKYVILTFNADEAVLKKVKLDYQLDDIFCYVPKRIYLKRAVRKVMYDCHLPIPYSMLKPYRYGKGSKKWFADYCHEHHIDVIQCEYIWHSDLLQQVFQDKSIVKILDTHDIQSGFTSGLKKNFGRTKNLVKEKDEIKICNLFDFVLGVSKEDTAYFREHIQHGDKKAFYIPVNPVDESYSFLPKPDHDAREIGFVAGMSDFNLSSIVWFIENVFSELPNEKPYHLNVYGSVCKGLQEYQQKDPRIVLHGFVKDPKDIYLQNDIMVNTTFQVGGIKIKCVESLLFSTPVLTTTMGSRGLTGAVEKKAMFVSDNPGEILRYVMNLTNEMIKEGSHGAYEFMKQEFNQSLVTSFYDAVEKQHNA